MQFSAQFIYRIRFVRARVALSAALNSASSGIKSVRRRKLGVQKCLHPFGAGQAQDPLGLIVRRG
jgi:hypothetical protein